MTVTVTTEPPGLDGPVAEPDGLVAGSVGVASEPVPVGLVAVPVGDVITLVPGVKVKTVVNPGPVIVITDCSGTEVVRVVTGPVGEVLDSIPVGLVFGPVGSVAGPVGVVMTLVPEVKVTVVVYPEPVIV